jgi:hypothetical protein
MDDAQVRRTIHHAGKRRIVAAREDINRVTPPGELIRHLGHVNVLPSAIHTA